MDECRVTGPSLRPAKQLAQRQSSVFADDVPARHIESGLGVQVAGQRQVHGIIDAVGTPGIESEQMGRDLGDGRTCTLAVSRQVGCAPRAALAPAVCSYVSVDAHQRAVEPVEEQATPGKVVAAAGQRQVELEH